MAVKWKTRKNRFPEMKRAAAELNGRRVNVGVYGEQAWLAGIHEYGCRIKVTDKMRAYLHRQGLHLKKSTEYITIPERAFLRNGYDLDRDDIFAKYCKISSGNGIVYLSAPVRSYTSVAANTGANVATLSKSPSRVQNIVGRHIDADGNGKGTVYGYINRSGQVYAYSATAIVSGDSLYIKSVPAPW